MTPKSYVCLFFFAGLASPAVGAGSGSCSVPGALDCRLHEAVASGEEDSGSLTLLQQQHSAKFADGAGALKAKTHKRADEADVWEQLTAAANIDDLQKELEKAKKDPKKYGSDVVKDMQAKYDELSEAFPDAKELKNKFHDQWKDIKKSVNLESMKAEAEKAKEVGSNMADALQDKYDEMSEKFKDIDVEDVKKNAQKQWNSIADQLPDMDDLKKQAEETAKKFGDSAQQLSAKVFSVYGNFNPSVSKQLEELESSFGDKLGDLKDQASDALDDLSDKVDDVIPDGVTDAVSGAVGQATDALKSSPLGGLFR